MVKMVVVDVRVKSNIVDLGVKIVIIIFVRGGVQTEIVVGIVRCTYDENGEMVVSGFDKEMPYLSYIVGTVSDHTLTTPRKRNQFEGSLRSKQQSRVLV